MRDQVAALALQREVEAAHVPARGAPLDERHAHRLGALGEGRDCPLLVPLRQRATSAGRLLAGEVRVQLARHQGVAQRLLALAPQALRQPLAPVEHRPQQQLDQPRRRRRHVALGTRLVILAVLVGAAVGAVGAVGGGRSLAGRRQGLAVLPASGQQPREAVAPLERRVRRALVLVGGLLPMAREGEQREGEARELRLRVAEQLREHAVVELRVLDLCGGGRAWPGRRAGEHGLHAHVVRRARGVVGAHARGSVCMCMCM